MKCLRCGYCCKNLSVMIIIDPTKELTKENVTYHSGDNNHCMHLKGSKPGEYLCNIHHYPIYKNTPCDEYTQVESHQNTNCRMGKYVLKL